jgi:hypothetical protein
VAATPTTKVQISWSDKSPIPMVNVYADTPEECDQLVNFVDQSYATWVAVGHAAHGTKNVVQSMGGTVVTPPVAAGQALPQPVQQAAAPAGHVCDCGQPMSLRSGKFGQFYSCSKRMDDPTRCKKTINVQ